MDSQPWLDSVRKRLARQSLPSAYVRRFMEELSDHFEDLKEENMESDAVSRMGKPEQVGDNAVAAYRRRSFLGRHPVAAFLVFAISPIVSLVSAFAILIGVIELIPGDNIRSLAQQLGPGGRMIAPYVLSIVFPMIPCMLGSMLHCKLARRLGLSGKWVGLSCAVLAVLAGLSIWTSKYSDIPGQSFLGLAVGLTIPQNTVDLPKMVACAFSDPLRLVQFLIPLLIGWWFMRRMRERDQPQLAS